MFKLFRMPIILTALLVLAPMTAQAQEVSVTASQQLVTATINGNLNGVKESLINGADINALNTDGYTPLMIALAQGHKNIASFLLTMKVNVRHKANNGFSALMIAMGTDSLYAVRQIRKQMRQSRKKGRQTARK